MKKNLVKYTLEFIVIVVDKQFFKKKSLYRKPIL